MSMSDCPKCWSTPCECGWDYRSANDGWLRKQIAMFSAIISYHAKNPQAKFSCPWKINKTETEDDIKIMEELKKIRS